MYRRALRGSLGIGEAYIDGDWDCGQLDEMFRRVLSSDIQQRPLFRAAGWLKELQSRLINLQTRRRSQRGRRRALRHRPPHVRALPRALEPVHLLLLRRHDRPRASRSREARDALRQARAQGRRPAARHRLRLGRLREVRGPDPRLRGHGHQPLRAADPLRSRLHEGTAGHDPQARLPRPAGRGAAAVRQGLDRRHDRARRLQELRRPHGRRAPGAEAGRPLPAAHHRQLRGDDGRRSLDREVHLPQLHGARDGPALERGRGQVRHRGLGKLRAHYVPTLQAWYDRFNANWDRIRRCRPKDPSTSASAGCGTTT